MVEFVLLRSYRFNIYCYAQREATPTQKSARKGRCDLSRLLARKITKGIHSCKPASLNRPSVVKMPLLLYLQNLQGKGDGQMEKKKKCFTSFWGWPEDCKFVGGKMRFWHPIARATIYCLLPDTFWLRAFKNALKVGTVNFANSLSPPFIVKKVCTGSKNSQGT